MGAGGPGIPNGDAGGGPIPYGPSAGPGANKPAGQRGGSRPGVAGASARSRPAGRAGGAEKDRVTACRGVGSMRVGANGDGGAQPQGPGPAAPSPGIGGRAGSELWRITGGRICGDGGTKPGWNGDIPGCMSGEGGGSGCNAQEGGMPSIVGIRSTLADLAGLAWTGRLRVKARGAKPGGLARRAASG